MSLHTEMGCTQTNPVDQTGKTGGAVCGNAATGGIGCTVSDASPASYGAPFAAAGGGVWAMEFATTGLSIWFWSRPDVPSSLANNTIDTSTFGTPSASWPASGCNTPQFFQEQEIVIDITLCGYWAGQSSVIQETCPALEGTNTCYSTYVLSPDNYDNAYFEIASVKMFATSPSVITSRQIAEF
jgi:hypothetical protein